MSLTEDTVHAMRTRDLRMLLRKLGMEQAEISKLIDKAELVAAAMKLISEEQNERNISERLKFAAYISIALGIGLFLYLSKDLMLSIASSTRQFFSEEIYRARIKLKMFRMAIRHRRLAAILALGLSLVCDFLVNSIHVSILASWVVPRGSFLRRYMVTTFSLPMSPQQILGLSGGSSFSLDVGPMITLFVLRWLSNHFNDIVGSQLIDIVDKKNAKRYNRRCRNSEGDSDSYSTTQTFFKHDSLFLARDNSSGSDENSWKDRFYGRNKGVSSKLSTIENSDSIEYDELDTFKTVDIMNENSILQEREDGSEEILFDAFQDGSSVICKLCKSLVKKDRWDVHQTVWCPSIQRDDERDSSFCADESLY